jgi:hypothetical protein
MRPSAPVMAEAARLCADVPIGPTQPGGSPVIVIGGATIRIPSAIDAATLQTVTAHPDGGDMITVADTVTSFRELQ